MKKTDFKLNCWEYGKKQKMFVEFCGEPGNRWSAAQSRLEGLD